MKNSAGEIHLIDGDQTACGIPASAGFSTCQLLVNVTCIDCLDAWIDKNQKEMAAYIGELS